MNDMAVFIFGRYFKFAFKSPGGEASSPHTPNFDYRLRGTKAMKIKWEYYSIPCYKTLLKAAVKYLNQEVNYKCFKDSSEF